jgi:hypothetical protein
MMGMENVNSVLLTGPFVSGDGLLFPSRTSWDGISRLRALENQVRLSERRLPSEEAMVPPLKKICAISRSHLRGSFRIEAVPTGLHIQ